MRSYPIVERRELEMIELVFATHNEHKLEEARALLSGVAELHMPREYGLTEEIPEDFDTIEQNAQQKSEFVYTAIGRDCFSDDTGLEVEALGGAPGAYSARYAGGSCNADANVEKLLRALDGQKHRAARFRTVVALVLGGERYMFEGCVDGEILTSRRGDCGFGYDPVFRPYGYAKSYAEMSLAEKNGLSHRARAMQALRQFLEGVAERH